MNREIKFRAWHSEFSEMVYSSDETLWEKREFYPFCIPVGFSHYPTGQWDLMQYTGIKDKNGKEIYEGDIVYRTSTSTTGDVRFRKGKFYVRWKGEAGYVMFDSDIETCEGSDEIKGNIFENPDVCDGKN